jgi:hypothetical protein
LSSEAPRHLAPVFSMTTKPCTTPRTSVGCQVINAGGRRSCLRTGTGVSGNGTRGLTAGSGDRSEWVE